VNLTLQTGEYGSALATAAGRGETETVKYLVEQGADVNLTLQTGEYGNALAAAAAQGNSKTVKYLVEQGADVTCRCRGDGTAVL
jgi:ankyrin repeat protein